MARWLDGGAFGHGRARGIRQAFGEANRLRHVAVDVDAAFDERAAERAQGRIGERGQRLVVAYRQHDARRLAELDARAVRQHHGQRHAAAPADRLGRALQPKHRALGDQLARRPRKQLVHGHACSRSRDLRFLRSAARTPSRPPYVRRRRWRSKRHTAAALATLSDSTPAANGIETRTAHRAKAAGERPAPSAPSIQPAGPSGKRASQRQTASRAAVPIQGSVVPAVEGLERHVLDELEAEVGALRGAQRLRAPQRCRRGRGQHRADAGGRGDAQQRADVARVLHAVEVHGVAGQPARRAAAIERHLEHQPAAAFDRRERIEQCRGELVDARRVDARETGLELGAPTRPHAPVPPRPDGRRPAPPVPDAGLRRASGPAPS